MSLEEKRIILRKQGEMGGEGKKLTWRKKRPLTLGRL